MDLIWEDEWYDGVMGGDGDHGSSSPADPLLGGWPPCKQAIMDGPMSGVKAGKVSTRVSNLFRLVGQCRAHAGTRVSLPSTGRPGRITWVAIVQIVHKLTRDWP